MDTADDAEPGSIGEALGELASVMKYFAAANYAELPSATLGEVLLALECADAASTAARAGR
jgi:hypothetical protein